MTDYQTIFGVASMGFFLMLCAIISYLLGRRDDTSDDDLSELDRQLMNDWRGRIRR